MIGNMDHLVFLFCITSIHMYVCLLHVYLYVYVFTKCMHWEGDGRSGVDAGYNVLVCGLF